MSEALDGIEWTPPAVALRPAAAVILVRGEDASSREVFWVQRADRLAFSGGFFAFPGGKVDRADGDLRLADTAPEEQAFRVAAIRETFEETGILLARGVEAIGADQRAGMRAELLAGASFAGLLQREGLELDGSRLRPAGRWVTPSFSPIRFDARFFLVEVPRDWDASVIKGELVDGGWVRPGEALARWEAGSVLLHPPTQVALATLAGFPPEAALPRLRRPAFMGPDDVNERIEFQRGVLLVPLRTPTLPPAQHTHCYILGTGDLLVVDPGSPWPEEQARLERLVLELVCEGRRVIAIALTHAHRDHTGGVEALARRLGVPVWAHHDVVARVPGACARLADGDVIELAGSLSMRWRVIHTPGHADGHLCFFEERSRALIAGDMVAGGSTIVIDPPEGDMGRYLDSLRRLLELGVGAIYPAHGMAIPDGPGLLRHYLQHRESRMEAIATAVASGLEDTRAIVERVYGDTPAYLWPAAERSALASLIELERLGRVRAVAGQVWQPV